MFESKPITTSFVKERSDRGLSIFSANEWKESGKLNDHPIYQREYIKKFDNSFKTGLIESVLCNAPIPSIYLCRKNGIDRTEYFEVIDGQQRIKTILDFYNGKWSLNKKSLDAEKWSNDDLNHLSGCFFNDLPEELQGHFRSYELHCDIFTESDDWTAKDIYNRLNRATTNLNAMEILKGEYANSSVWKALYRFSDSNEWKDFCTAKHIAKGKPDKRNLRYKTLESLFHHLLLADLGRSGESSNHLFTGTKGQMTTSFIESICSPSSNYDASVAIGNTRDFIEVCYSVFGEYPFSLIRYNHQGSPGGEHDQKFFTMHFQIISYALSRAILEFRSSHVKQNKKAIYELFHSIANDDLTMFETSDGKIKPLRYHFIEGRVMGHSAINHRINLFWPQLFAMLDCAKSRNTTLAPDRLNDLWILGVNRCSFTNEQIVSKSDAVVAHIGWQRSNFEDGLENLTLTTRLENWVRSKQEGPRSLLLD